MEESPSKATPSKKLLGRVVVEEGKKITYYYEYKLQSDSPVDGHLISGTFDIRMILSVNPAVKAKKAGKEMNVP